MDVDDTKKMKSSVGYLHPGWKQRRREELKSSEMDQYYVRKDKLALPTICNMNNLLPVRRVGDRDKTLKFLIRLKVYIRLTRK
ncbi:hypothetical protein L2E82_51775 [Cichorium intybus]|nr:hypothetical protein L2E82_51775 [Cichorium intybus]